MADLRLLMLVPNLATDTRSGGAESFAARLAARLDPGVVEVHLAALWQYGTPKEQQWASELTSAGVPVHFLAPGTDHLLADTRVASRALFRLVSDLRPAILHSHAEQTDALNAWVRAAHPLHPRAVRTMHTDQQWQRRPWAGYLLINLFFPLLFNREVAISKAIQRVLDRRPLARLLRRQSPILRNAISEELFAETPRQPASPAGAPPRAPGRARAVVIGRLAPQKGHSHLLEALRLANQQVELELLVIGEGELAAPLREQAGLLGLSDQVCFLGYRADVLDLLRGADLLVSASLWEGFPTVILEAMALNIPVVATDVSGSQELVIPGQTGWLVPPADPARLAGALVDAIRHPELARQYSAAARASAQQFTIGPVARQYEALYRSLLI